MTTDPHRWKTPRTPKGMPPTAWPEKRRAMYIEAVEREDRDIPRPVHPPGECRECDKMRELIALAGKATVEVPRSDPGRPAEDAPAGTQTWIAGQPLLDRIGELRLYPGALALILGLVAGVVVGSTFGLLIGLAFPVTILAIAIVAAY